MAQTLELIIKARDEASRKLSEIEKKLGVFGTAAGAAGFAMGGMALAIKGVQKAYEDAILPVMDYNRELLRMAEATGMSLEEAGRIAEVAEDAGITLPALAGALELATKNGFDPTLASIAALADEIAGMNDPSERAEYLSKLLGRNWEVLLPLLQGGGPAFLELAAAVNEGLLPTEQFTADTEALRIRVDELNESFEVQKLKILEGLIPAFLDGANAAANFLIQLGLVNASGGIGAGQTGEYGSRGGQGLGPEPPAPPERNVRQFGGPVMPGSSYLVGEHGAERFTPGEAGKISAADDKLVQAINRMVRTLPTILRDAVEKAK